MTTAPLPASGQLEGVVAECDDERLGAAGARGQRERDLRIRRFEGRHGDAVLPEGVGEGADGVGEVLEPADRAGDRSAVQIDIERRLLIASDTFMKSRPLTVRRDGTGAPSTTPDRTSARRYNIIGDIIAGR